MTQTFLKKIKDLIIINPKIRSGIPCFKNTEIPISLVIKHIAKGWSVDNIKMIFPALKTSDIKKLIFYLSEEFSNGKEKNKTWSFNNR